MEGITENQKEKALLVATGQENLIKLIKKYDITTDFSADFIFGNFGEIRVCWLSGELR